MDKFADVACLYGEFRQPAMFGKGTPSTKDFEFLRRVARSGQLNVKPWTKHPHVLTSRVLRRVAIPWRRVPSRPALSSTMFSVKIQD